MKDKNFLNKRDGLLFLGLFIIAALIFLVVELAPGGNTVVIEKDGEVVLSRNIYMLAEPEEIEITGHNGVKVKILLEQNGVAVVSSTCPDLTCVKTGKIAKAGETAICLPARVSVRITGQNTADAQTY